MNISRTQNLVETIEESASFKDRRRSGMSKNERFTENITFVVQSFSKTFISVIWRFFPTNHR